MFTKVYPYLETFHKLYWISLEKKGGIGKFLFFDGWLVISLCTGPVSMFCLLELVAVAPDMLASKFISQLNWIKVCIQGLSCGFCLLLLLFLTLHSDAHSLLFQSYVFSSREDLKSYASQLLAIVTCCQPEADVLDTLTDFLSKMSDKVPQFFP